MLTRKLLFTVGAVALAYGLTAGCDGKLDHSASGAEDSGTFADRGDAGATVVATPPCILVGDECSNGRDPCCRPLGVYRVDLARHCISKTLTPLYCEPKPATATSKCGAVSDEVTCFSRETDGGVGVEAGLEVFMNIYYVRPPPGFAPCDEATAETAFSAPSCP